MKRILIVEDEQDIQELLEAYLGDAGYETATAGDGIEAVSRFQQEAFDLVLLDVMLPKLDGFGVCELIRRQLPQQDGHGDAPGRPGAGAAHRPGV